MITSEIALYRLLNDHDRTFYIPPYQRNYEWDIEQCHVFLNDIIKTYKDNSDENKTKSYWGEIILKHFFGSVTYFETGNSSAQTQELVLIDGQQRITTTLLFLIALRDITSDDNLRETINYQIVDDEEIHKCPILLN